MTRAQDEPLLPAETAGEVPPPRGVDTAPAAARPPRSAGSGDGGRPATARVAVLAVGALCLFSVGVMVFDFWGMVRVFPGVAALAVVLCAITLLFGYWALRRIRPVRAPDTKTSLVAVAWGFTGAAGLALLANNAFSGIWAKSISVEFAEKWDAALSAPLNEEALKIVGIVLIALAFPRAVRGPMDGFVIGSLVGLGFQVVENFFYALLSVIQSGAVNVMVSAGLSSVMRVLVTGLATHWALSALTGTAVGLIAASAWRPGARRSVMALLLVLTAMVLHWLFDAPLWTGNAGVLGRVLFNFALVMVVYFVVRRFYRRRVLAALEKEGEALGMGRSEARSLARRRGRRKALRAIPEADRAQTAERQRYLVDVAEDRAAARGAPAAQT